MGSDVSALAVHTDCFVIPDDPPEDKWGALECVLEKDTQDARSGLTDDLQDQLFQWSWRVITESRAGKHKRVYELPQCGEREKVAAAVQKLFGGYGVVADKGFALRAATGDEKEELRRKRRAFFRKDHNRQEIIRTLADLSGLVYELDEGYLEGETARAQWDAIMAGSEASPSMQHCRKRSQTNAASLPSGLELDVPRVVTEPSSADSSPNSFRKAVNAAADRLEDDTNETLAFHAKARGIHGGEGCKAGLQLVQFIRTEEGLQAALFVNERTKHVLFCFRGTDELTDVMKDVSIVKVSVGRGAKAAKGFVSQYASGLHADGGELSSAEPAGLLKKALELLDGKGPEWGILIAGHSLGGALSNLCALDMLRRTQFQVFLTTFGSPRVGNKAFRDELQQYASQGRLQAFRVQFQNDIVTRVPYIGYHHFGTHVWAVDNVVVVQDKGTTWASWHPCCEPCRLRPCGYGVSDHKMQHSMKALHDNCRVWVDRRGARETKFDVTVAKALTELDLRRRHSSIGAAVTRPNVHEAPSKKLICGCC